MKNPNTGQNLGIAVEIADAVSVAQSTGQPLNVEDTAIDISKRHGENASSSDDIAAALQDESDEAGVETSPIS